MKRNSIRDKQRKQPLLYLYALSYQSPVDDSGSGGERIQREESDGYAYYWPLRSLEQERWAERALCVSERFLYTREPLSWQELEAARLVPANRRTRLQLALAYDQQTCQEIPMAWATPHGRVEDGGELLAWYELADLWGATSFGSREGRMGTIFAKTREPLVEAALRQGYTPHPTLLDRVRELPGMGTGAIRPVFLSQGYTQDEQAPLLAYILANGVQGATNRDPWLVAPAWPPEWVVSLFCEDRHMALSYASATLPTVEQVLRQVLSLASSLESYPNREEWMRASEIDAEAMPYEVCLMQTGQVKELLGPAYGAFMGAFHQAEQVQEASFGART
jgi:hypothetical protein